MLTVLAVSLNVLGALQGTEHGSIPFEALGKALLATAETRNTAEQEADDSCPRERSFQERLAPLFERVELGALQLWLPLAQLSHAGELEPAQRPRAWKELAEGLLELEERWLEALTLRSGEDTLALEPDFAALRTCLRGKRGEDVTEAALRVRRALLQADEELLALAVILAPTRAHYAAVIGAAGVHWPEFQDELWSVEVRRSPSRRICRSALALALTVGPAKPESPWYAETELKTVDARQQAVHAVSHLLSSELLTGAPAWFTEGLAVRDTVLVEGADETLCSGYTGREPTLFDDWAEVPQRFLAYTRLERSPYRGEGAAGLFARELRRARTKDGFRIADLDRSRTAFVASGPFLSPAARVPGEVVSGPSGLKEGFAEFLRAYCAAFPQWLSEVEHDGTNLLRATLRGLLPRAPQDGASTAPRTRADLASVLLDLTGYTLGESVEPGRDLEAAYAVWLGRRR